ncbi:CarD family transcriptional regulator [Clostridium frigidicarnis]|uniref:Transcriptional regulator, CarD family n=1 Tax=Clostridium frigidicarnis TaxID=84698 RepID=A0A1I0Z2X9_9CLOT|nr:CarD family transcriptional regulator [Clostridium frigidicarnis]SFB18623.1 transcriptional regulator, CarD family [Clostridium frigidicarnis]
MFKIGDNVVYPMQGIGVIKNIEEKDFTGENKQYFIIQMLHNNMEVMIPADRISNSNLRLISDGDTLDNILLSFKDRVCDLDDLAASRQRYQLNMEKIKSGSLEDCADVLYELTQINKEKTLNSSEKQMLTNAKRFMVTEISAIKEISEDKADDLLNSSLEL